MPEREIEEIHEIFEEYKVERSAIQPLIQHLKANPKIWVDFMVIILLIQDESNYICINASLNLVSNVQILIEPGYLL
jgi:hypothetical protein